MIGASNANANVATRNLQADVIFAPIVYPTVTWSGLSGGGGTASWDTTSPNNWNGSAGTAVLYADGDAVIFSSTSANNNITISGTGVAPVNLNIY